MEKIVRERQAFIDGNIEEAEECLKKADELSNQHEEKLLDARNAARSEYLNSIDEYKSKKAQIVQNEQSVSNDELKVAYEQLNNVSNETKEGLKARMNDLANDIVERILGYRSEVQGFDNEKVNEVFQDVFDDEEITVNDETTADDIEDWDSLEHINLIVAVENCFGIKFNMGEVTTMKNVGAMVDLILSRIS